MSTLTRARLPGIATQVSQHSIAPNGTDLRAARMWCFPGYTRPYVQLGLSKAGAAFKDHAHGLRPTLRHVSCRLGIGTTMAPTFRTTIDVLFRRGRGNSDRLPGTRQPRGVGAGA